VLSPITLVERTLGIGSRVVGGALDLGRRALGTVSPTTATEDAKADGSGAATTRKKKPGPPRTQPSRPRTRDPKPEITDTALARKVESELFRAADAPKDTVDVNAVGRVVYLRGEAKTPELIKELEARCVAIPEVQRVENLLHLPKTPSPTRSDTPPRQRKEKTTQGKPPSSHRRRINSEKPVEGAEPSPEELAKEGSGRQPAPLGSDGSGDADEES
jgi:BON domain